MSPESQCSADLSAQHGIDESAEVMAIGSCVTANELRMKSTSNRLTIEIVKARRRLLCKFKIIVPDF
jgi:hypothetical protein